MTPLPPTPSTGKPIIEWALEAQKTLRRLRPVAGPGIRITEGTNNLIISADRSAGGSGAAEVKPFQLSVVMSDDETPVPMIRVVASTLAGGSSTGGTPDLDFSEADIPPFLLTPAVGVLVGGITINETTGAITSRWLEILSEMPADEDDTFYIEIGTVAQDEDDVWYVNNSCYGPVGVVICRNWFASAVPFFNVALEGS